MTLSSKTAQKNIIMHGYRRKPSYIIHQATISSHCDDFPACFLYNSFLFPNFFASNACIVINGRGYNFIVPFRSKFINRSPYPKSHHKPLWCRRKWQWVDLHHEGHEYRRVHLCTFVWEYNIPRRWQKSRLPRAEFCIRGRFLPMGYKPISSVGESIRRWLLLMLPVQDSQRFFVSLAAFLCFTMSVSMFCC